MTVRVCMIGVGSIAKAAHGPALRRLQQEGLAVLSGCAGISMEESRPFAEKFGFARPYDDYEKMIREEKPDLTFCLLPVKLNASAAIHVMKNGGNAVMEKPPGADLEETRSILEAEKACGKRCGVLFNRRSMPLVQKLKKLVDDSGEKIQAVTLEMTRSARTHEDFTTTAVHGVDCIRFLAGDFEELAFDYQNDQVKGFVNYYVSGKTVGDIHTEMRFLPNTGGVTERINVYTDNSQYTLHMPMWNGITYAAGPDSPGQLSIISEETVKSLIRGDIYSDSTEGYVLNGFYDEDKKILSTYSELPDIFTIQSSIQSIEITDAMRNQVRTYRKE